MTARSDRDGAESENTGASQAVETRREHAPDRVDALPPFHVILHNDDVNSMEHVVDALVTVTPVKRAPAVEIMLVAHNRGRSIVTTAHRELAELYRDRLRARRLSATIERAV